MKLPQRTPPISLDHDYQYVEGENGRYVKKHISEINRDHQQAFIPMPSQAIVIASSGGCGT